MLSRSVWLGYAGTDRSRVEDIGAAICWCFRLSRAARETEGHKNRPRPRWPRSDADDRRALCLCPRSATDKVKFAGQSLRLFDQCRDDAFSILVRDLDQHHVARMTLDKRCDIAVPGPADQVALPMARHGAIFNRCRAFSDGHGILYLAEPVSFKAGVLGAADSAFRSKVLKQFLFSAPHAPQ